MLGEFEAAVTEIIEKVAPEIIVVETTGLAEPEALVFNIQEALPQCRLDGVVSVIDADMLVRFPELGHTTRLQIEGADILLLNKIDLVDANADRAARSEAARNQSDCGNCSHRALPNRSGTIVRHRAERKVVPPEHEHQPEFESFTFSSDKTFSRDCFERFADALPASVIRAKGFVRFRDGAQLFNFVAGRWELEPFEADRTELVFIGKEIAAEKSAILHALEKCTANKAK